jgi:hypothetical protein
MKTSFLFRSLLVALIGFSSLYCNASSQYSVSVVQVGTYQPTTGNPNTSGMIYFRVSSARSGYPSCTTAGNAASWAVNTTNADIAKIQVSQLQLALSQGRPVNIYGTGDCNINGVGQFGSFEVVNYL